MLGACSIRQYQVKPFSEILKWEREEREQWMGMSGMFSETKNF